MKAVVSSLVVALASLVVSSPLHAAAPTKDDVTKAMRTMWEKPGGNGNPKITLDVNSLKIGKTAPANEAGILDGIPRGADVTAALIDFTVREHGPKSTQAVKRVREIKVYKNNLDEWTAMITATRGQDEITDEPASK